MAGPYHLELVAKDGELTLHVMDHADHTISTGGGMGKATIQTGKTRIQVELQPAGDNTLKGTGEFSVLPESVIIVFIRLPDQEAYSARFTPLKSRNTLVKKNQNRKP